MNKNLGGRGKKSPYETTHVRLPLPIKDRVEALKSLYISGELDNYDKKLHEDSELADRYRNMLTGNNPPSVSDKKLPVDLDNALAEARSILKSKQSARKSVIKLLTALYGIEITDDDLNA
ncbi:hypothetical protein NIES4101_28250 (plasmid) [Calothrix sp. NIES-4101]|nr:hypothetical protein NIES4101_28250 [Calothrix sp. NIES-4101]